MPWTPKQVRFLLSKGSPLNLAQKSKMTGELHADPSMGHKKKGYHKEGHTSVEMPTKQAFAHAFRKSELKEAPATCTHCGMPRGHEFHRMPIPALQREKM